MGGLPVKDVTIIALVDLLTRELAIKHTWTLVKSKLVFCSVKLKDVLQSEWFSYVLCT